MDSMGPSACQPVSSQAVLWLVFCIVLALITKNKTPFVLAQGKVGAAGDWETWSCFLEPQCREGGQVSYRLAQTENLSRTYWLHSLLPSPLPAPPLSLVHSMPWAALSPQPSAPGVGRLLRQVEREEWVMGLDTGVSHSDPPPFPAPAQSHPHDSRGPLPARAPLRPPLHGL